MEKIGVHEKSLSLSTHLLRMISFGSEIPLAFGTGFLYEFEDEIFLITNGHNVTRMNPEQGSRIATFSAAFPVKIKTKARIVSEKSPDFMGSTFFEIDLYNDDDFRLPKWYMHPEFGYKVDVIAIPLESKKNIPSHVRLYPINRYDFDSQFPVEVADDAFILGYPFNITGDMELPIWKRGTIASEPGIDIDGLPKMFIDTATRSGMSGAPVIMRRTGFHGLMSELTSKDIFGMIENFVGVYSGRIGAENELQAQLGIVWKSKVIEEILKAKILGDIKFQNL